MKRYVHISLWHMVFVASVILAACGGASPGSQAEGESGGGMSLSDALSTDIEGYARAYDVARAWRFPFDHGPHPDYKLEWWYVTGNLVDASGGDWGYQVTIFRNAIAPPPAEEAAPDSASAATSEPAASEPAAAWASRQLYIAHVAVTDVAGGRYRSEERVLRGGGGLAGARADRMHVWAGPVSMMSSAAGLDTLRIEAPVQDMLLDLTLTAQKPIVLQGEEGFSPKSDEPGNASWYYALTRFSAEGTVRPLGPGAAERSGTSAGGAVDVSGTGWLDREWSTSLLGRTQTGWDWFSLQLDDGRDLMYFQLREREESERAAPGSSLRKRMPFVDASLVLVDGTRGLLDARDVALEVLSEWTSPHSGATYPAAWRLRHEGLGLDLTIEPLLADQEFQASVRYWEGAVRVSGSHAGRGYVELTGY